MSDDPVADRLSAIREMRRNNPDAYDADRKLQAEERELLTIQSGDAAPANLSRTSQQSQWLNDMRMMRRLDPDQYDSRPDVQEYERLLLEHFNGD